MENWSIKRNGMKMSQHKLKIFFNRCWGGQSESLQTQAHRYMPHTITQGIPNVAKLEPTSVLLIHWLFRGE